MSDLISRSALIDSLVDCEMLKGRRTIEAVVVTIKAQPTVEAKPVVHGKWITHYTTLGKYYECSICGNTGDCKKNFCSNCGTDMRGVKND